MSVKIVYAISKPLSLHPEKSSTELILHFSFLSPSPNSRALEQRTTIKAREKYRFAKYKKQVEWAITIIERNYIMWKRRHFLLTLPLRLQPSSLSPICNEWISAPRFLHEASQLLKNIFHRWRVSRSSRRIRSCSVGPLIRFASHTSTFSHSLTANSATSTETCLIKRPEIEWGKKSLPAYCSRIERRLMSRGEDCHLIWFSHDIYDDIASTTSVAWSAAALQLNRKKTLSFFPHQTLNLTLVSFVLATVDSTSSSLVSSVSHPFLGDYVRLRQNVQWKKICVENNDQYVVFADIVNKIARSSGKYVPILLVLSTSSMLLLDQRTLQIKYRIPASEIYRMSLSPFVDDIAVFHVKAVSVF